MLSVELHVFLLKTSVFFSVQFNSDSLTAQSGQWNANDNIVHLFSVIFKKTWPVTGRRDIDMSPDVVLKHILSWPSSYQFFDFFRESAFCHKN